MQTWSRVQQTFGWPITPQSWYRRGHELPSEILLFPPTPVEVVEAAEGLTGTADSKGTVPVA